MDGSPLARLVVVLIFLVLLGVPVVALTREKPAVEAVVTTPAAQAAVQSVDVSVTLSHPGMVDIRLADQVVLASEAPTASLERVLTVPGSTADLTVKFQWPDGRVSHAGRVTVSHDGEVWADQTFWGETEVVDVVKVQEPAQP
jgi:hypothetical protein